MDDFSEDFYNMYNMGDNPSPSAIENVFGHAGTIDDALDNIYGNASTSDEAMDSVGAYITASDSPYFITSSPSSPEVVELSSPLFIEEVELDLSRVQVTYEADPQYFPCRERDDEPIPQLIQNYERGRSRSNSTCSSRISSSTGDYLESTESLDGIRSPDENDADDEKDSSPENDDDRGSLIIRQDDEDTRDDFGDDECSDTETRRRTRKIPSSKRRRRSVPSHRKSRRAGRDTSSESDEDEDKENEDNGRAATSLSDDPDNNASVDLDYPYRDKGLRIDLVREGFHSDYSEYNDNDHIPIGREEVVNDLSSSGSEEVDSGDVDLVTTIKRNFNRPTPICEPEVPQTATHISALPLEMIFYILRWVVTDQLDLRSLEKFSMVCRGFYICSRDSELWRSACKRVWSTEEDLCLVPYSNWRTMYLSRPRLNFNGCYVSKSIYIRYGEDKLRDRFYRPWNVVHNYKYLRFFPEGMVLLLRTNDKNRPLADYLNRNNNFRGPGCLMGYYKLQNDHISLMFARNEVANNMRVREILYDISNGHVGESYRIELQLVSVRNWLNGVLVWKTYAIMNRRGYSSSETELDVKSQKYPPFWFSRFKTPPRYPVGPL